MKPNIRYPEIWPHGGLLQPTTQLWRDLRAPPNPVLCPRGNSVPTPYLSPEEPFRRTPPALRAPCTQPQCLPPAPRDPCSRLQSALTPRFPNPEGLPPLDARRLSCPAHDGPRAPDPRLPVLPPRTDDGGGSVTGTGVRRAPRRWQRLSWQCRNCTEALKIGRRRKLKRAAPGRGGGGGKATEESAGQPPRSSARAGPGAGREDGVTEQWCRTRPQRGEGRARAA